MKTFVKTGKLLVLVIALAILGSCDDDTTAPFEVLGDVYILKRVENNDAVFALSAYAYANNPMSLAKVTTPDAEELVLEPLAGTQNNYALEPERTDFSSDLPTIGNYMFDVLNEDVPHQAVDLLQFDDLGIPQIDTTYFNEPTQTMTLEWTPDDDAESYLVKMTQLDGEIIYIGQLLSGTTSKFAIDQNTGSWFSFIETGKPYIVELHAILYEADAPSDRYMYNVQEISITEKEIIWGE